MFANTSPRAPRRRIEARHRHVAGRAFVLDRGLRARMIGDFAPHAGVPIRVARRVRHDRRAPVVADRHVLAGRRVQPAVTRDAAIRRYEGVPTCRSSVSAWRRIASATQNENDSQRHDLQSFLRGDAVTILPRDAFHNPERGARAHAQRLRFAIVSRLRSRSSLHAAAPALAGSPPHADARRKPDGDGRRLRSRLRGVPLERRPRAQLERGRLRSPAAELHRLQLRDRASRTAIGRRSSIAAARNAASTGSCRRSEAR